MPTQQRASSTNTPKARSPEANFHTTGAPRAVEAWLTIARCVTERFARAPITAGAYPFLRFSASFFCALANAFSAVGCASVLLWPASPMRP